MATRIKDGMIPYTGGQGIEITNNHVINVLLREMNNLIQVNGDRELYVDLQLDDGIAPDDDFPVGVTTGKILQEDGWQQSGIILNWKTTSGDYVRLIYANDGKLYYDPGTGQWIEFGGGGQTVGVATATTLGTVKLGSDTEQTEAAQTPTSTEDRTYAVQLNNNNQAVVNVPRTDTTYTAGTNITIDQNNEISATIPQALVYKGTVNDLSDLPASGTVGDTYFVEGEDGMYSWDGTQWAYVGGTGIDTSNFFDKTIDTSDDIVQGTTNLFVTQQEKDTWNNKQDRLTAGDGIDITNNVISNTLPFNPGNAGSLGQFLKKTNDGYAWANVPGGGTSYTAGDGIDITNHIITNTAPFEPTNQGNVGQVLKKSGSNTYYWDDESGGGGGDNRIKLFTINSEQDTTIITSVIKEAIDWYNAGKLPILKGYRGDWGEYSLKGRRFFTPSEFGKIDNDDYLTFTAPYNETDYAIDTVEGVTRMAIPVVRVVYNGNTIISANIGSSSALWSDFLSTTYNYSTPYTPRYNGSPATKKYVDDKNWVGTQAQYDQLTPQSGVIYNIIN